MSRGSFARTWRGSRGCRTILHRAIRRGHSLLSHDIWVCRMPLWSATAWAREFVCRSLSLCPEFTRAIVLVEGSSSSRGSGHGRPRGGHCVGGGKKTAVDRVSLRQHDASSSWTDTLIANDWLHGRKISPDQAIIDYFASMARWDRSRFEGAVKSSSCPIVVLQSTSLDDCEVRRSISEQPRSRWRDGIERYCPDSTVVEVPGASHLLMLDRPNVVANEILVAISRQGDATGDRRIRTARMDDHTDPVGDQLSNNSCKG